MSSNRALIESHPGTIFSFPFSPLSLSLETISRSISLIFTEKINSRSLDYKSSIRSFEGRGRMLVEKFVLHSPDSRVTLRAYDSSFSAYSRGWAYKGNLSRARAPSSTTTPRLSLDFRSSIERYFLSERFTYFLSPFYPRMPGIHFIRFLFFSFFFCADAKNIRDTIDEATLHPGPRTIFEHTVFNSCSRRIAYRVNAIMQFFF